MDNIKILKELEKYILPFPLLTKKWTIFCPQLKKYYKNEHKLLLQRIKVDNNFDIKLNKGINNLIDNNELKVYECYYLIKLCLTGKNNLSDILKKQINNILIEFKLQKQVYTININLIKKTSLTIYPSLISELSKYDLPLTKIESYKNIQSYLKNFFNDKLPLPFLMNASYINKKFVAHPITFPTYLNMFFLDEKRKYKIFAEEQSNYWRKRVIQIILGLKGIPAISFFQTQLAENNFYKSIANNLKNNITTRVYKTNKENLLEWEKRLFNLLKRKESLKNLKTSILTMADQDFHLNIEKKIEYEISKLNHKLHKLKTKELLILKEIKYLGGNFKPQQTNKQNNNNKQQFSLFQKPNKMSNDNLKKIEELIANYYINLSKIEVLEDSITDLQTNKQTSLKNIEHNKTIKDVDKDINSIDQEIQKLINKNYKYIIELNQYHDLIVNESLFKRTLNKEGKTIIQCLDTLKNNYSQEHKTILLNFFKYLKDNLNYFDFPKVHSISFNRLYMPKISYEDKVASFNDLTDYQKDIFIICFYLTILKLSIDNKGYTPSLLIIYLPDKLRKNSTKYINKIKKLLENDTNYQIIIF